LSPCFALSLSPRLLVPDSAVLRFPRAPLLPAPLPLSSSAAIGSEWLRNYASLAPTVLAIDGSTNRCLTLPSRLSTLSSPGAPLLPRCASCLQVGLPASQPPRLRAERTKSAHDRSRGLADPLIQDARQRPFRDKEHRQLGQDGAGFGRVRHPPPACPVTAGDRARGPLGHEGAAGAGFHAGFQGVARHGAVCYPIRP
jgi:hypothetical protein